MKTLRITNTGIVVLPTLLMLLWMKEECVQMLYTRCLFTFWVQWVKQQKQPRPYDIPRNSSCCRCKHFLRSGERWKEVMMEVNNKRQHYVRVFSPDGGWGRRETTFITLRNFQQKTERARVIWTGYLCTSTQLLYAYTSKHACIHTYILMDKCVQDMH